MGQLGAGERTAAVALCLCSVVTTGCADGTTEGSHGESVQVVLSEHATRTLDLRDRSPSASIGSGSATGSPDLFRINAAVVLPNDRIAVANGGTQQVLFFDTGGRYIGAAGRRGQGPDEFAALTGLWIIGDSLLTFDPGNNRFTMRDLEGELARTFRPERQAAMFAPVALMDSTVIAVNGAGLSGDYPDGISIDTVTVSRHDLSGGLVRAYGRFPYRSRMAFSGGEVRATLASPFSAPASFVAYENGLCHAFGPLAEISCLDAESGMPWLTIRPDAGLRRVTEAHKDGYWEDALASTNAPRRRMLTRFREEIAFPANLPAYSSLLVDSSDQIWAGVFRAPGDEHAEWHVFWEGRWEISVLLPPGFQVMDVRGDWLIGVDEDELGVESLAVYDLEGIL